MNMEWAPGKDERLLSARDGGATFRDAGERLGVSRNAAIGRYHRLKGTTFPSQIQRIKQQQQDTRRRRRIRSERERAQAAILDAMEDAMNAGMMRNDAIAMAAKAGCPTGLIASRVQLSRQRVDKIVRAREVALGNKSNHV